jgi:hypothetical protein
MALTDPINAKMAVEGSGTAATDTGAWRVMVKSAVDIVGVVVERSESCALPKYSPGTDVGVMVNVKSCSSEIAPVASKSCTAFVLLPPSIVRKAFVGAPVLAEPRML